MIDYFFWGMIILFGSTAIFYIVFFSLMYYWHETKATFVIVPLIFTFDFFLVAFLVISIIVLVLQYAPEVLKLL